MSSPLDIKKCWTHAASSDRVDHLDVYAVVSTLEIDEALQNELLFGPVQPERLSWLIDSTEQVAPAVAERAVEYRRMMHNAPNFTMTFRGQAGGPLEPLPEPVLRESVMTFAHAYIGWLQLAHQANVPLIQVDDAAPFEIFDKARVEDAIRSFRASNGFGAAADE